MGGYITICYIFRADMYGWWTREEYNAGPWNVYGWWDPIEDIYIYIYIHISYVYRSLAWFDLVWFWFGFVLVWFSLVWFGLEGFVNGGFALTDVWRCRADVSATV